ncbi:MAG: hypothetical protein AMJ68_11485 [Acidithiobacillales bacterium SG8_45]|nr:MAG: hypothetical protein AMJ68_11485 [Acidithiobacillales bacterium SG8_45]
MNQLWQSFLSDNGAEFDSETGSRFGTAIDEIGAVSTDNVLIDLSHLGLLRATGEDAKSFLLSQLTNDLNQVTESRSQISAYCTPKGRMLALFRIFIHRDQLMLQAPASVIDAVLPRLRMYVMRAKVVLEPANDLVSIGLSGPDSETMLADQFDGLPANPGDAAQTGQVSVVRLAGPHPRFLVTGETDAIIDLWQQLSGRCSVAGSAAWSWLDIMAGQPSVVPQTSEVFVPQMANLDVIDGVNFKKGCYPGQEIVARMQYLGKLKQRMYRAHIDIDTRPSPGDSLFAPSFREQSAGTVVDAQVSPEGGFDFLAVIQIRAADEGELHLGATDGPLIRLLDLPYELPPAKVG